MVSNKVNKLGNNMQEGSGDKYLCSTDLELFRKIDIMINIRLC